jgi:hypothetical protein
LSALRLELKPSLWLAGAIVAAHAAAAGAAIAALPSTAGVALAMLLAALGAASAWHRALLGPRAAGRALEIDGSDLALVLRSGERMPALAAERRYASRFLVIVPLLRPRRRTILVTPGMLDADSFRRLRIWALWGKLPGAVAGEQLPA